MFKLAFTLETSHNVDGLVSRVVQRLNRRAADLFSQKKYGEDIYEIIIGLICVEPSVQAMGFLLPRKPRLQKKRRETKLLDGRLVVSEKLMTWDVNLDHSMVQGMNEAQFFNYLISTVEESLMHLKKYKNFSADKFADDFEQLRE